MNIKKKNQYYFVGKWVALDDKDRLLSLSDTRVKALEEAQMCVFLDEKAGIRLYKLPEPYIKDKIKELLDR